MTAASLLLWLRRASGRRVSDVSSVVWLRGLVALSLVMGGAAVSNGSARSEPPGPSPSRETVPLSFDAGALARLNGVAPGADATAACGSSTETFLTELFHTSPTAVK